MYFIYLVITPGYYTWLLHLVITPGYSLYTVLTFLTSWGQPRPPAISLVLPRPPVTSRSSAPSPPSRTCPLWLTWVSLSLITQWGLSKFPPNMPDILLLRDGITRWVESVGWSQCIVGGCAVIQDVHKHVVGGRGTCPYVIP